MAKKNSTKTKPSTKSGGNSGRARPLTPRAGLKSTRYGCGGKLNK